MKRLTILHTNDIHGHLDGFTRIATRVSQIRQTATHPVLYLDAGDIEETNNHLSSATKGVAMHQLHSAVGCDAAAVGNGGLLRYSHLQLKRYAEVARYPLLLANIVLPDGKTIVGVRPSTIIQAGDVRVGLIGLTDPFSVYSFLFGLHSLEIVPLVRELALELRQSGADLVVLLSHLGWQRKEPSAMSDQKLALEVQTEVDLIIGAHTHHLLEHGVQIGRVWVAQAGKYAEHLGRIELEQSDGVWEIACSVEAITRDIAPDPQTLALIQNFEQQLETQLAEVVCVLETDFVYSQLEPCVVGYLVADALRQYWDADVGLSISGIGFRRNLPKGNLTRGMVVESIPTAANPARIKLHGWQLLEVVQRGQNLETATQPLLRGGVALGIMHTSGLEQRNGEWFVGLAPLEPERIYTVAATDAELDGSFAYLEAAWGLETEYKIDMILNEVVLDYVQKHKHLSV
jgi:2',3'-cyclic-nucleotide 2'-phosphodiesterase (5'-nucleotidase family)